MKRITFVMVLAVAACAAIAIWFSGGRTMKPVGENRTTTSRDGTIIAYTKRGSGPPLIIVDGAFCYRETGPATELASILMQHFTVFTYDRRGRGQSGATALYSVEPEIEDLQATNRIPARTGITPLRELPSKAADAAARHCLQVARDRIVLGDHLPGPWHLPCHIGNRGFEACR